MNAADRLTVYADYVCPFCFFGHESLSRYQKRRSDPLDVDWHPFDLRADERDPDGTLNPNPRGGKDKAYFDDVRTDVERLAESYGLELAQPIARDVDSWNAQLASVHIQLEHPTHWEAFDDAVYDALWLEGRDVGDPSVLAELAIAVGLEGDEVRAALQDPMVERRLEDQLEAARLRGISGVPTFVSGEHTVRGAVPPEQLRRLIEGE